MDDENNSNISSTEREEDGIAQFFPWLLSSEEAKRNWPDAYVGETLVAMTEQGGNTKSFESRIKDAMGASIHKNSPASSKIVR